jgi:hypothetical protein
MRPKILFISALLFTFGCAGNSSFPVSQPVPTARSYNGTASVGDFMNITIHPAAATISYTEFVQW